MKLKMGKIISVVFMLLVIPATKQTKQASNDSSSAISNSSGAVQFDCPASVLVGHHACILPLLQHILPVQ